MSQAGMRRPRAAAVPAARDDKLNNGGVDVSAEEDDHIDDLVENVTTPVAHRTRSRSVSPHVIRTKQITVRQETVTYPNHANKPSPSLSDTELPPPQPFQPTYQPTVPYSPAAFPLVTKRRLRFWIPLLVSLLLSLLLLYIRSPHNSHSPSRWTQSHSRHPADEQLVTHHKSRREAVYNPSQRTEYDQYASHQDDKEEIAKERARRIINEVHGVAAQIKQEEPQVDEKLLPHYHPLKTAHPTAKDITREMQERYETHSESSWGQRVADWLGFGPYLRLEKREDGIHHMRGDDDHDTDKYDYIRGAATSRGRASVHEKHVGEGEAATGQESEVDVPHLNSMLAHLKELEGRFGDQVDAIKQRITEKTVPPYEQMRADDKHPAFPPATTSAEDDSVPVHFISTSPDHPLLDPLHSILRSVESLIARPVTPPTPPAATSYWSRLMQTVFPSSVSDTARDMYDIARYEASKEASRVRRAMTVQYDKVRAELHAIGQAVKGGTSEPLELYEQYNPEPVNTTDMTGLPMEKAKATTHHTKEK